MIGYEILKHFKGQRLSRETRKHKKSFNDQNLNSDSRERGSSSHTLKEEEVKSAKDFDSKQLTVSSRRIEPLELPREAKKRRYAEMLHFSSLRRMARRQDELKALHGQYFLIRHFKSSTVGDG